LISLFGEDPVIMAASGVLLSHVALLVALYLVFKLTELEWGNEYAQTAVWLLAFSPAAPYFGAVYTESLFMALLAATFLAARKQLWLLGGLWGAVAALLRNSGFLIAGALLFEAWGHRKDDKTTSKWLCWSLPLVIFIAVQASFWLKFGDPLAGVTSQEYFHRQPAWPWKPLFGDLYTLIAGDYGLGFFLVAAVGLFFTLAGLLSPLLLRVKIRPGYILLIFAITLMNLVYARQLAPHTITATRYLGSLFPVAQIAALFYIKTNSPRLRMLMVAVLVFHFIIFSYMFGLKSFLG
jgi:Gpi18-like mannosyltransferase